MSEEEKKIYVSLANAAEGTPYSQEYLGLLVRKGKLNARKFGRNWYTTKAAVDAYTLRQRELLLKKVGGVSGDLIAAAPQSIPSHMVSDSTRYALTDEKLEESATATVQSATDAVPLRPGVLGRFASRLGREAAVMGLILALSAAAGVAGVHGIREWQAARVSAVRPAEEENISTFQDLTTAVAETVEKSRDDLSALAAAADAPLGVQDRVVSFFAPLRRSVSRMADAVRALFGERATKIVETNIIPPRVPASPPAPESVASADASLPEVAPLAPRPGSAVITQVREIQVREIIERKETLVPADLAVIKRDVLASVEILNRAIRDEVGKSVADLRASLSRVSSTASSASSQAASSIQMVTVSQDIDHLTKLTVSKGLTISSGDLTLSKGTFTIDSGGIIADSLSARTSIGTGDLSIGGGDLIFGNVATTTIPQNLVNAFSISTSTTAIPFLTFDTANYRIGVGTTSPAATLSLAGDLLASGRLTLAGGDLQFSRVGTTTIPAGAVNAFSIGTSTTAIPFLTFDTANYRIGIGSTSPAMTFSVNGNVLISQALTIGNTLTTQGASATTSFLGKTEFSFVPTLAHSFSPWSIGASGSNVLNAPVVINPASAAADTNLFGIALNGSPRLLVDAEGDIFANSITTVGGSVLATTTASNFTIENSLIAGDAVGDVVTINAGSIRYENFATSSIRNNSVNAWGIVASTTDTSIFSVDTSVSGGRIGIGTTSPWGLFSIEQTQIEPIFVVSDKGTSTPHFWIDGTGNVGISTTSPTSLFSIGAPNASPGGLYYNGALGIATSSPGAALAVATTTTGTQTVLLVSNLGSGYTMWAEDEANDTTPFVIQADGNVGVGTAAPSQLLHIAGSTSRGLYNSGHAAFGASGAISAAQVINVQETFSNTSGDRAGVYSDITFDTAGSQGAIGVWGEVRATAGSGTYTNALAGVYGEGLADGASTVNSLMGVLTLANARAGGPVTNAYGIYNQVWKGTGTLTNAYGMYYAQVPNANPDTGATSGTVTNQYGVGIADLTRGTSRNIGVLLDDSTVGASPSGNFGILQENTYVNSFAGNVGIGTVSPIQALHIVGQCVTGDTRLRRRRRKS
ncbi:MAG: hypothetical protein AAB533_00850, partial [Patescibacteria group bacterium]